MARFDVYRNTSPNRTDYPYLLDIQSDHLGALDTRVVIPLRRMASMPRIVRMPLDLLPTLE
ncbi:CcdB family protein [Massilia sp. W12]|uniref:CcdB family protein n=1 Tax=Massilia sp. W12 TaxID=3126507 RepID=UPI0030CCDE49